jgi:hypothetical protein
LITSGRLLDNMTSFQLEFTENIAGVLLTLSENVLELGSWPVLVMWFDTAIEVYIVVIDVPIQALLAVSHP